MPNFITTNRLLAGDESAERLLSIELRLRYVENAVSETILSRGRRLHGTKEMA